MTKDSLEENTFSDIRYKHCEVCFTSSSSWIRALKASLRESIFLCIFSLPSSTPRLAKLSNAFLNTNTPFGSVSYIQHILHAFNCKYLTWKHNDQVLLLITHYPVWKTYDICRLFIFQKSSKNLCLFAVLQVFITLHITVNKTIIFSIISHVSKIVKLYIIVKNIYLFICLFFSVPLRAKCCH